MIKFFYFIKQDKKLHLQHYHHINIVIIYLFKQKKSIILKQKECYFVIKALLHFIIYYFL